MRVFGVIILLFLFLLGIVWVRTGINRSGREIGQLQNEVEVKEARNQYLRLEILRLSSPQRITQEAKEKLGFEPVKPHHVIILENK